MYYNNKIFVGSSDKELSILLNMANRHGLITGASGTGKTITLKVMAESFSEAGVPVFLADVKGDLAGMCTPGISNDNITERLNKLNIKDFTFKSFPTCFWDIFGINGHPIRTTVKDIGPTILARMLGLTEAQEGVLSIAFKIADDEALELIDLNDLRLLLQYIGDKRSDYTLKYGNVSLQSVGAIQRNLLKLEEQDGKLLFGEPSLDIKDFIKFSTENGHGYINILDARELFHKPTLYATFLLWLLTKLFETLPEVGDLAKPKIVFFFDEAHLLFEDMPDYLIKQVIQIVKLIRSKGIGLYFISQSPKDIPDDVLAQLSNRVTHALRAYTPAEQKVIKAAATSFRTNPNFDTEEAITSLGTGEALISFLNENGEPNIVEKATILPPQSQMGTIDDTLRQEVISQSSLKGKYDIRIERESAFEKLNVKIANEAKAIEEEKKAKELAKQSKQTKKKKTMADKAVEKTANSAFNTLGRKIGNSIFKGLFK